MDQEKASTLNSYVAHPSILVVGQLGVVAASLPRQMVRQLADEIASTPN
jgi:hypothetical protein